MQSLLSLAVKALGWTERTFADFAEVLIMFRCYPGFWAFIVGMLSHLAYTGTLGYLFACLIKNTSSKYFLFKVIAWGFFLWFISLGVGTIFRLPRFTDIPPVPALMTLIGSIVYSFLNGYILRYFDKKTNLL